MRFMGHLFPTAEVSCASVALFGRRSSATFKRTFRICRAACWSYYIILILKGNAELHQRRPQTVWTPHPTWRKPKETKTISERKKAATPTNTKAAKSKIALSTSTANCLGKETVRPRKEPALEDAAKLSKAASDDPKSACPSVKLELLES